MTFISVSPLCSSPALFKTIKVLLAMAGMSEFLMVVERDRALLTDELELTLVLLLILLLVITVLVLLE